MRLKILTTSLASGCAFLMLVVQTGSAQTPTVDTSRGLSIRYADGRTTSMALRSRGGRVTAVFPRIDGMDTAREGMALTGLDVHHVVEGLEVVVTVSLLYRSGPREETVEITTVRLVSDRSVIVDELRRYGVEPIILSIAAIPPAYTFAPRGVSVSTNLDIEATPVGPNAAAYRVTIKNRAPVPLMWLRYEAHRSDGPPASALPRGKRDFPLAMPNGEYSFDLPMGAMSHSGADDQSWQPLDRIEVTAVMWQDGVVEGSEATARQKYAFDRQRAGHLRNLLRMLRGTRRSITALRDDILRTSPPDVEMRQARDALVQQLDGFAGQQLASSSSEFETWLAQTLMDLEQWLARIVFPKL